MITDFIFQSAHRAYAAEFAAAQSGEPAAAIHAAALREAIARAFLAKIEEDAVEEQRRKDAVDAKFRDVNLADVARKAYLLSKNGCSFLISCVKVLKAEKDTDLPETYAFVKQHFEELRIEESRLWKIGI